MSDSNYDAAIIGGGFKGMMTAYGLIRQGMSVCIIDRADQLGGFMSAMRWRDTEIDKGPQYLDGISRPHKVILDDIMSEHEPLASLNYSYGTFWNQQYTEGFALPDYRTLADDEQAIVLYETITAQTTTTSADTIAQLYTEENPVCYSHIRRWCKKFLQNDAEQLSALNRNIVTFFGRKLILDNDLSLELKQLPYLDDRLAANKKTIDHDTFNLYPKGKNLGYFRQAFEQKLIAMGVTLFLENEATEIETRQHKHRLRLKDGSQVNADAVYCAATIENTESLLLGTDSISEYIEPVAQVFYLLELDLQQELPFYIMNYSDSSISRITNFTAYGNPGESGKDILCVEVPTTMDSQLWNDPDSHYTQLCAEMREMGLDPDTIHAHQAFKVPSTYRAVLRGYEQQLTTISDRIADRHGDSTHILTPHLLTRSSIMHDLSGRDILK